MYLYITSPSWDSQGTRNYRLLGRVYCSLNFLIVSLKQSRLKSIIILSLQQKSILLPALSKAKEVVLGAANPNISFLKLAGKVA